METVAIIAVGLFAIMIVAAIMVLMVRRIRASHKNFVERKKALARMTDDWFKVFYQNHQKINWKGIPRRERKVYEMELKRRNIKI